MSTPSDPHDQPSQSQQPGQPEHRQQLEQPAYPSYPQSPPYGYPQYQGYQQPPGYSPYGTWPGYQAPTEPPSRPPVLVAAGVIWLLVGAGMALIGLVLALASRLPETKDLYADNPEITSMFTGIGVAVAVLGAIVIGLAVPVFSGAMWARIAISASGGLLALLAIGTFVVPVMVIVAIVLQFLPSVNAYAAAKRRRTV